MLAINQQFSKFNLHFQTLIDSSFLGQQKNANLLHHQPHCKSRPDQQQQQHETLKHLKCLWIVYQLDRKFNRFFVAKESGSPRGALVKNVSQNRARAIIWFMIDRTTKHEKCIFFIQFLLLFFALNRVCQEESDNRVVRELLEQRMHPTNCRWQEQIQRKVDQASALGKVCSIELWESS